MHPTKKIAPGAFDAQGLANIEQLDSAAQRDFTPDAAASALQLLGGNPHASLIGAHAAIKAISAAADTLAAIVGRGS
jgi:hypothetical protein